MTTLNDLLNAVELLPWDDVEKLQARIEQRRNREQNIPRIYDDLQRQIDDALKQTTPINLTSGTMDVAKLAAAVQAMRDGFTQTELNEIADAMDEEYIKPEIPNNGE